MKNTKKYASPFQWETNNDGSHSTTFKRGDFDVSVDVTYDYGHDFCEFRGKFSSKYEAGAIKNSCARFDHNTCEWFIPEYTLAERQRDYTSLGYARHDAYLRARKELMEDLLTAAEPESVGALAVQIDVAVSYKDINLADECACGLEVKDFDDPEIDSIAQEKIEEALDRAKEKLAELRV